MAAVAEMKCRKKIPAEPDVCDGGSAGILLVTAKR